MNKPLVVVGMSGGVDSSVAAYLLQREGFEVIGVTIKTWQSVDCDKTRARCCSSGKDAGDARRVAEKLGIPHYTLDLAADFKENVIDDFIDEYLSGRTPNPCIRCNSRVKFDLLRRKAEELGGGLIATGHYAGVGFDPIEGRYCVTSSPNREKDQSYVLFELSQEALAALRFPIGRYGKSEVRRLAAEAGLPVHDKPDSQEICFVEGHYGEFLSKYAGPALPGPGDFVNEAGEIVGRHEGFCHYTIGQKKRIRITHTPDYYVVGIDAAGNRVILGPESSLFSSVMRVRASNWQLTPKLGSAVHVKVRSRHEKTPASIVSLENGIATVRFLEPQKAVTPGQAAVLYDGDRVIGGGWIE